MTRTLAPRDPTCLLMFLFFHSPLSGALWPCAPLIAREFESIPITVAIAALHLAPNGTPLATVACPESGRPSPCRTGICTQPELCTRCSAGTPYARAV